MNRFRMAYGRSGTRLTGILVSSPHEEPAADPRWLTWLLLAVWISVPVLFSRLAVSHSPSLQTVIDPSHLAEKLVTAVEPPVVREQPGVEPIPHHVPLPAKLAPPPPVEPKRAEPPPVAKMQAELPRATNAVENPLEVTISRSSAPKSYRDQDSTPTVARGRSLALPDPGPAGRVTFSRSAPVGISENPSSRPTVVRGRTAESREIAGTPGRIVRREAPAFALPGSGAVMTATAMTRTRGTAAAGPSSGPLPEAVRRQPAGDSLFSGEGAVHGTLARSSRPSGMDLTEGSPHPAFRGRGKTAGAGDGEGTSSLDLARGISLSSLGICSSPRAEEEGIRAVMSLVGSRSGCSNGQGEFQFKGTQRISSFNLIIFPAKGRTPANRCEELENAYKCLKNR